MTPTDTSEKGLEDLIVASLTRTTSDQGITGNGVREDSPPHSAGGYVLGSAADYDRANAVDLAQLLAFLRATQPKMVEVLNLESDGPGRAQFLGRLRGEIAKRGVVDVLRKGIKHGPASIALFYGTPTPGNVKAAEQYAANIFSVTRQLRYSPDETQLALDLALFINGLPVATFELKNNFTKQTYQEAINQYKRDRNPQELLFQPGRCAVHFALDDQEVWMCSELAGNSSWFLPFNKGYKDGAGNPPNPFGLKTDYLWTEVLSRASLTDILENYAQTVVEKGSGGKKGKQQQIFPRYHQLGVVRGLLADARVQGAGRRYLIQHSAGSGKSNSIAWLAHQLVEVKAEGGRRETEGPGAPVFDTIVVVTDRKVLDKQIRDTIRQFAQVGGIVGEARDSGDLKEFIEAGQKIIISTVQKFPRILDEIGNQHRGRSFAIVIDEAHSSQGGHTAGKMNAVLAGGAVDSDDDDETVEDQINRAMAARKMLPNASYFAFTATPKNKTLETFGERIATGDGVSFRPFHSYTMKQAIQEGFIRDVLQNYTPINSYYRLMKTVEGDPEFDAKRAKRKLRLYVEGHQHAIGQKAEIMVDHFHEQVIARKKVGGQARAMVVTNGIERAIRYFHTIEAYLRERKSPYRAIVAFSGEHNDGRVPVTEATLNGFPSQFIPDRFKEDPYRFLVVADKFQTGYDEPLLHTMYVDKQLAGIKAVQTLSRLNRAHPQKHDTFVLDFLNEVETIEMAFSDYYRTTVLSGETDPNKLHDEQAELDAAEVYGWDEIDRLVGLYLGGADRDKLDPILDVCRQRYVDELDEDEQVAFKGKAKAFVRTYGFLASILSYSNAEWEKLSIFLNFLIPKLPAPKEDDLSQGILDTIDMESYRVEVRAAMSIALADEEATIEPVPTGAIGVRPEPEIELLSAIVKTFNEQFGNIDWKDTDKIQKLLTEEIPAKVATDKAYQNAMKQGDPQNARIEHDAALQRVIMDLMMDHSELFKQFMDNAAFKRQLSDLVFKATYQPPSQ